MGIDDKARHKAENLKGRAKEAAGDLTDDKDTENEGKAEQNKAEFKEHLDKAKDSVNDKID